MNAAISADGSRVVTGHSDDTAKLWDAATGEILQTFEETDWVSDVAISPDKSKILTGSGTFGSSGRGRSATLWDAEMGEIIHTFPHTSAVEAVAFSPDGSRILTGSHDRTAKLWDAETGEELQVFRGHSDNGVMSVTFSPDGAQVLTGGWDGSARLWDVATGEQLNKCTVGGVGFCGSVSFSPDGSLLLLTEGNWDNYGGAVLKRSEDPRRSLDVFRGHSYMAYSAGFFPDAETIFTTSGDRSVILWDVETGEPLYTIEFHGGSIRAALSSDGTVLVTGSGDGTGMLWDTSDFVAPISAVLDFEPY